MILQLFHTSNVVVERPDVKFSRDFLDFGKGFYLTTIYEQAKNYATRFTRREKQAFINHYQLEIEPNDWKILYFDKYNKEWLDFVAQNRAGISNSEYDMIVGGIANDKVVRTLDRYFNGGLSEQEALNMLVYEKPNIQYCICSQELIDKCLTFIKVEEL